LLWSTSQDQSQAPKEIFLWEFVRTARISIITPLIQPMDYEKEYENSLHHSKVFQAYAEKLANTSWKNFGVSDKRVIEIGSGREIFSVWSLAWKK
jgi:hypothetical protein